MNEIIDLIDKEEILETEEKIEKALKKEQEQRQLSKNPRKDDDFTDTEKNFVFKNEALELEQKVKEHAKNVNLFK